MVSWGMRVRNGSSKLRQRQQRGGWKTHFFQKAIIGLFCGADFDCAHHFAGGNDDAAEDFWLGVHTDCGEGGSWA